MKNVLEKRLDELKREFESGQKMVSELEAKQSNIRTTLLRISGAIQVLEELLANASESQGPACATPPKEETIPVSAGSE